MLKCLKVKALKHLYASTKSPQRFLIQFVVAIIDCFNKAFNTAAVKTLAFEFIGQYAAALGLHHQGIGNLDLAT